jgi:hypothetical protein
MDFFRHYSIFLCTPKCPGSYPLLGIADLHHLCSKKKQGKNLPIKMHIFKFEPLYKMCEKSCISTCQFHNWHLLNFWGHIPKKTGFLNDNILTDERFGSRKDLYKDKALYTSTDKTLCDPINPILGGYSVALLKIVSVEHYILLPKPFFFLNSRQSWSMVWIVP